LSLWPMCACVLPSCAIMDQQAVWYAPGTSAGGVGVAFRRVHGGVRRLPGAVSSAVLTYSASPPHGSVGGCIPSWTSRACSNRMSEIETAAPIKPLLAPATARHGVSTRFSHTAAPLNLTRCMPKRPTSTEYSRPSLLTSRVVSAPVTAAAQFEGFETCDSLSSSVHSSIGASAICSSAIGTSARSCDNGSQSCEESHPSSRKSPLAVAALRAATASAAAAAAATAAAGALQKEVDRLTLELQRRELCVACREAPRQVCFQPCGHCCTCLACAARLKCCAICRSPVEKRLRAYLD